MSSQIVLENQNFDRGNIISNFIVYRYRTFAFERIQELGKGVKRQHCN